MRCQDKKQTMSDQPLAKYQIVEQAILKAIADGEIKDKLPGERTLAVQFGFSYMTVRKAINNLVNQDVLYKVQSKGAFVKSQTEAPKTLTLGYFIDKAIVAGIGSPYYSMIFNALEKEAALHDYSVIYFSDSDLNRLDKILKKVDGVIATCFPYNEQTIAYMKTKVPVLVIDNASEDLSIPSVVIDNFNADYNTVKYLHNLGHQRIAFLAGLFDSAVGKDRLQGYKQALLDLNLPSDEALIFNGNYMFDSGMEAADYFLQLPELPDAIISANDSMALGVIQRLKEAHINVPDDISVVGFDNISVASQVVPALTTLATPTDDIAYHAYTILKKMIDGEEVAQRHLSIPAKLIERDSCQAKAAS